MNADSHFMQINGIIAEGEWLPQWPIGLKITLCQERLSIHSLNASPSNVLLFAWIRYDLWMKLGSIKTGNIRTQHLNITVFPNHTLSKCWIYIFELLPIYKIYIIFSIHLPQRHL